MTSFVKRLGFSLIALVAGGCALPAAAGELPLFDGRDLTSLVHVDHGAGRTMALATDMLAGDLTALSGQAPKTSATPQTCARTCILIGLYDAPTIRKLAREGGVDLSDLKGQWEVYRRVVIRREGRAYVLIAGSDVRGAVYGAVDLSRELGVSAWSWWADVTPRRQDRLAISDAVVTSQTPSVKYRGVFINDEDWGLEPWAAKTLDPETGNIGPKTYAKVYQLLWRLKADTLWPAMHSISTPFFGNPGNAPLAKDYAIVIGTSHAEPMLRNNLREWDETKKGPFDFTHNRSAILDYWRERIDQSKPYEDIYTVGLRGIHDGPMQGATTTAQREQILEDVIGQQRTLLEKELKTPIAYVPQVYVAYHELQEAYDAGLKIPDDVTLMWADDNYGYIRELSTPAEQQRSGGSGVYYHLSYWGRPHDYLWLATTHPALIHEEMQRAYAENDRRIWIVNVGDIKPAEYLTQYFLDLAFDASRFDETPHAYLKGFMSAQFGPEHADELADLMMRYYDLAFARRPEFMGFGQTEWVTPNQPDAFAEADGEEAQARIRAYQDITARAEKLAALMPADRKSAYFELVLYPVRAAANLNTRIMSLDLASLYAREQRASPNAYVAAARAAHAQIVSDTLTYNGLENGKWRHIMDMAPRDLPVFDEPMWPSWSASTKTGCGIALSGQWYNDHNTLPFVAGRAEDRRVAVFAHQPIDAVWRQTKGANHLALSATSGALNGDDRYEARLVLHYDGQGPAGDSEIHLSCGGEDHMIYVHVLPELPAGVPVEDNRIVTLPAAGQTTGADWRRIDGLGSMGGVLRARLDLPAQPDDAPPQSAPAVYRFATSTAAGGVLKLIALPTHPLTRDLKVRMAAQLDDGPVQTFDFSTLGRSDQWRENVLTNTAVRESPLRMLAAGEHTLKVWPLDPGVMLDRIDIDLDGARAHYGPASSGPQTQTHTQAQSH